MRIRSFRLFESEVDPIWEEIKYIFDIAVDAGYYVLNYKGSNTEYEVAVYNASGPQRNLTHLRNADISASDYNISEEKFVLMCFELDRRLKAMGYQVSYAVHDIDTLHDIDGIHQLRWYYKKLYLSITIQIDSI